MDIRQEFEAFAGTRLRLNKDRTGNYINEESVIAWEAYQAGRRAGAEDMRERAAKVCVNDESGRDSGGYFSDAIRALPIGGE